MRREKARGPNDQLSKLTKICKNKGASVQEAAWLLL